MIPEDRLKLMTKTVRDFPELSGGRVVLYGNQTCRVLDAGVVGSKNLTEVMVMIEEVNVTDASINADTLQWSGMQGGSPPGSVNPRVITNSSRLSAELTGMALSCGLTVVSAGLMLAGGALTVPTGGAGLALFVVGWVGLAASAVQCGNAIARVGEINAHPDDDSITTLDNYTPYQQASFIVDAIGVATAIASLPAGIKSLIQFSKARQVWAARGLTEAGLKNMSRADRAIVMRELIEEASKSEQGRRLVAQAVKDAQDSARLLSGTGLAAKASQQMSQQLGRALLRQISMDTLKRLHLSMVSAASGVSGPGFSAMKSEWVGSASGSVNTTANWIIHVLDGSPAK